MPSRWQKFKASISPENGPVFAAAPTQEVRNRKFAGRASSAPIITEKSVFDVSETSLGAEVTSAKRPNIFDRITRGAGSSGTFFFMMALLALWAVCGIVYGTTDTWQIILQNASSIKVYVTDILLLRQQKNAILALKTTLAQIQPIEEEIEESLRIAQGEQTRWKKIWGSTCYFFAITLGSLWAFIFYWIGIFVWVGIGPLLQFSDQ
ncbi:uncharacterized protein L3040_002095 [Drepanopeziza brunnea f. sp. 'multigermtubi']|uniref:uncharacterized protein n=1 Tax=Drepanopeziza brunnea f. sp. 'multigermtubi' TaxID=698441 RepID=UPI0023962689|nr:hypothetical protein L3040_002095 [Drepanopeziza brunnea f. sp. 'multigermtubi']